MKIHLRLAAALLALGVAAFAQQASTTSVDGHAISVRAVPLAAKNRAAGAFHTDADLVFSGFNVPKGDYTVYVLADGNQWQLALNSATGAKAATYDPKLDLGRLLLAMSKAPAGSPQGPAACKWTVKQIAAMAAMLEVVWNDTAASASFHLDRGPNDSEW